MKLLERDLESKLINYNNNPIDKWCLANTSVDEDKNGNIQPMKIIKEYKKDRRHGSSSGRLCSLYGQAGRIQQPDLRG